MTSRSSFAGSIILTVYSFILSPFRSAVSVSLFIANCNLKVMNQGETKGVVLQESTIIKDDKQLQEMEDRKYPHIKEEPE
jgi:hypothetical protein